MTHLNKNGVYDPLIPIPARRRVYSIGFLLIVAIIGLIIWRPWISDGSVIIENIEDNTVAVQRLVLLEDGPGVFRIIDTEYRKLCYANAAGGGMHCVDLGSTLEDLGYITEHQKEEKIEEIRASIRRKPVPGQYGNQASYNYTPKTGAYNQKSGTSDRTGS